MSAASASTYQQLHADRDAAIDDIVERYHAMADGLRCGRHRRQRLHRTWPAPPS